MSTAQAMPQEWRRRIADARVIASVLTIFAILAPDVAAAASYRYWRGSGTSTAWGQTYNWAASENGAIGQTVPGANDVVVFTSVNATRGSGNVLVTIRQNVEIGGLILSPTFTGSLRVGTGKILLGRTGLRLGSGRLQLGTGTILASSGSITMTGGILSNEKASNQIRTSGSFLHLGGALNFTGTLVFNGVVDQTFAYRRNTTVTATQKYINSSFSGIILANTGGGTSDDVIVSGATLFLRRLTVNTGNFDMDFRKVNLRLSGSLTIANDSNASFTMSSTGTLTTSGSISTGASGTFSMSNGGTIDLNGGAGVRQTVDLERAKITNLQVTRSSSGILASDLTVRGALTINTGSLLAFGANSLYATGSSIVNYGQIKEDTGKLSHTGSSFVVGNSNYSRLEIFRDGEVVYFTLTDKDENISGTAADTVTITVTLTKDGSTIDTETVTLTETTKEGGIFRGSIATKNATASSSDGTLQHTKDGNIGAVYTDAQDGLKNSDGGVFQVTGASSTTTSGGSGGGGGGRRAPASVPNTSRRPTTTRKVTPKVAPAPKKVTPPKISAAAKKKAEAAKKKAEAAKKKRMDARKSKTSKKKK